jgi:catechol 2,3-dioxygenase-like lactoylglutathione lyase family enzyme
MEQRLSLVTLGVGDLAKARGFYEKLGWRPLAGPESVVFFQLPGMMFALWSREELAKDAGLSPAATGGKSAFSGIALAYNARSKADADAVLKEAQEAGAELLKPAADTFWGGYSGYFRDPDGHVWEVAWNPHWTIGADGSVRAG